MDSSSDDDEEAPEPEPATLLVQPEHARGAIGRGTQRRNRMQNAPVRQQISQLKDSMRMFKQREKEGKQKLQEITRAPSLVFNHDSDSDY